MKIVVDTNIVFSTLLNPYSQIGEIVMNLQDDFTFFAPELLKEEIDRYSAKIEQFTKLDKKLIQSVKYLIFDSITFVSEELISSNSWNAAYELTKGVDEDDTPFIALSIELQTNLWTGDKKLREGLKTKIPGLIISTEELKIYLSKT